MHILFLSDNFPPEVNAPASRTFEHCREWVKAGHSVTVITCAPNFPQGQVFPGYRNRLYQTELLDGIKVIRVWSYITRNEGFAKRTLDYLSYMVMAFIAAIFVRRIDLIVGTSPQFFTACAAYGVGVVKRRPWIFELRDIWPDSIRAVGAINKDRLLVVLEKIELYLYRKATAIVAVTNAFKRNLIERGIKSDKIFVVTNGVDLARFSPQSKDRELQIRHKLQGKFVAGYIGTHGMAHALDTLIDVAITFRDSGEKQFHILMLGDGAERARLQARADAEGLDNITFVDSVPKEEVIRYWSLVDVAVIHLRRTPLFKTVIPSKMFECMGMAIPILHGVEGESAEIVNRHHAGLTFEPENGQALATELRLLAGNAELRKRLAQNGRAAALHYDRAALANHMLDIILSHSQAPR